MCFINIQLILFFNCIQITKQHQAYPMQYFYPRQALSLPTSGKYLGGRVSCYFLSLECPRLFCLLTLPPSDVTYFTPFRINK